MDNIWLEFKVCVGEICSQFGKYNFSRFFHKKEGNSLSGFSDFEMSNTLDENVTAYTVDYLTLEPSGVVSCQYEQTSYASFGVNWNTILSIPSGLPGGRWRLPYHIDQLCGPIGAETPIDRVEVSTILTFSFDDERFDDDIPKTLTYQFEHIFD